MDVLTSECSSGCESGWTLYFEHSMDGGEGGGVSLRDPSPFLGKKNRAATLFSKRVEDDEVDDEEEEEEEDLSMVSDASSGPPHLHEEGEEDMNPYQCHEGYAIHERMEVESASKRRRKKMMSMGDQHCPSQLLDDTASSPFINFFPTQNFMLTTNATPMDSLLGYPHGYPTAHFEGSSAFEHQFGISQPSLSSHQFQNKSQCSARKKMGFR